MPCHIHLSNWNANNSAFTWNPPCATGCVHTPAQYNGRVAQVADGGFAPAFVREGVCVDVALSPVRPNTPATPANGRQQATGNALPLLHVVPPIGTWRNRLVPSFQGQTRRTSPAMDCRLMPCVDGGHDMPCPAHVPNGPILRSRMVGSNYADCHDGREKSDRVALSSVTGRADRKPSHGQTNGYFAAKNGYCWRRATQEREVGVK